MFTQALYYPYILVPDNLWLRRAILYWDKICPIMPQQVEREIPEKHISRELISCGVLEFIHPEDRLGYEEGCILSRSFLQIVTSEEFLRKIGPAEKRNYHWRIHRDKFTHGLLEGLRGLDLLKSSNPWLQVETHTGILYMGFLASSLAERLNLEPITDDKSYQNGFLWSRLIPSPTPSTLTSLILEELLPAPKEDIPVKKIIEFKEKHQRELVAFRNVIRGTLRSLESVTEAGQFRRKLESVKDEIKEQSLILHRKLRENRIETVFSVLETPFNISIPEAVPISAGTIISVPVALAIFGARAVIKIVNEIFKGRMREDSILETSPYSYVFNVKKQLTKRGV